MSGVHPKIVENPRYPFVELHAAAVGVRPRKLVPITVAHTVEEAAAATTPNRLAVAVTEFSYVTATGGPGSTVSLRVIDPSFDRFETHLLESLDLPVLWFRFGWRFSNGAEVASQLMPMRIMSWEGEFVGSSTYAATVLNITAIDDTVLLSTQSSQDGIKAGASITDAIEQVVAKVKGGTSGNRLVVDVRAGTTTLLTDALNKLHNRTPLRYIQDVLKYADSEGLFLTYYSEFKEGSWHLVIDQVKPTDEPQRVYVFSRDRQGEMLNFRPNYTGLLIRGVGGGRVDGIGADASTLTASPVSSTAEDDDDQAHGAFFPRDDEKDSPSRILNFASREQQLIDAYTKARRRKADFATYPATADLIGDPKIMPLKNVVVVVSKGAHAHQAGQDLFREGEYHHSSGLYTVMRVTHSLTPGVYRTQLELQRASGHIGPVKAKKAGGLLQQKWIRSTITQAEQEVERTAQLLGFD